MKDHYDNSAPPKQPIVLDATPQMDDASLSHSGVSLLRTIGLTTPVATTFVFTDLVETAMTDMTLGLFLVFSVLMAFPLGYFAYVQQRKAGDSTHEAASKAIFLAALTAVPVVCIASLVAAPMGICGYLANKQAKQ